MPVAALTHPAAVRLQGYGRTKWSPERFVTRTRKATPIGAASTRFQYRSKSMWVNSLGPISFPAACWMQRARPTLAKVANRHRGWFDRGEGGAPSASLGDGDRAVLERAGSCQAADGGRIDGVAPGDVSLCLALCKAMQCLVALMR